MFSYIKGEYGLGVFIVIGALLGFGNEGNLILIAPKEIDPFEPPPAIPPALSAIPPKTPPKSNFLFSLILSKYILSST